MPIRKSDIINRSGGSGIKEWDVTPTYNSPILPQQDITGNASFDNNGFLQSNSDVAWVLYDEGGSAWSYDKNIQLEVQYEKDTSVSGEIAVWGLTTDDGTNIENDIKAIVDGNTPSSDGIIICSKDLTQSDNQTRIQIGGNNLPTKQLYVELLDSTPDSNFEYLLLSVYNNLVKGVVGHDNGEGVFLKKSTLTDTLDSTGLTDEFRAFYGIYNSDGGTVGTSKLKVNTPLEEKQVELIRNEELRDGEGDYTQEDYSVFSFAKPYNHLGTLASYTQVSSFPQDTETDDILITTIDNSFTGDYDDVKPFDQEVVRPEQQVKVTGTNSYDIIQEPRDFVGELDVTPIYEPAQLNEPVLSETSKGTWDSNTNTFTPNFDNTGSLEIAYALFEDTLPKESVAVTFEMITGAGFFQAVGFTTSPSTLSQDLQALFAGTQRQGDIRMATSANQGSGEIVQYLQDVNNTQKSSFIMNPSNPADGNGVILYMGYNAINNLEINSGFTGYTEDDGSSYDLTGTIESAEFPTEDAVLFTAVLTPDATAGTPPINKIDIGGEHEPNPEVEGTSMEGNESQSNLDNTHIEPYRNYFGYPEKITQLTSLPPYVYTGDIYKAINRHPTITATPLGTNVRDGDYILVKTPTSIMNTEALDKERFKEHYETLSGTRLFTVSNSSSTNSSGNFQNMYEEARRYIDTTGNSAILYFQDLITSLNITEGNFNVGNIEFESLDVSKSFITNSNGSSDDVRALVDVEDTSQSVYMDLSEDIAYERSGDTETVDTTSSSGYSLKKKFKNLVFKNTGGVNTFIDLAQYNDGSGINAEIEFENCYFDSFPTFIKNTNTQTKLIFRNCYSPASSSSADNYIDTGNSVLKIEQYDSSLDGIKIQNAISELYYKAHRTRDRADQNSISTDLQLIKAHSSASVDYVFADINGYNFTSSGTNWYDGTKFPVVNTNAVFKLENVTIFYPQYFKDVNDNIIGADFYIGQNVINPGVLSLTSSQTINYLYRTNYIENQSTVTGENVTEALNNSTPAMTAYEIRTNNPNEGRKFSSLQNLMDSNPEKPCIVYNFERTQTISGTYDFSEMQIIGMQLSTVPTEDTKAEIYFNNAPTAFFEYAENIFFNFTDGTIPADGYPTYPIWLHQSTIRLQSGATSNLFDLGLGSPGIVCGDNIEFKNYSNYPMFRTTETSFNFDVHVRGSTPPHFFSQIDSAGILDSSDADVSNRRVNFYFESIPPCVIGLSRNVLPNTTIGIKDRRGGYLDDNKTIVADAQHNYETLNTFIEDISYYEQAGYERFIAKNYNKVDDEINQQITSVSALTSQQRRNLTFEDCHITLNDTLEVFPGMFRGDCRIVQDVNGYLNGYAYGEELDGRLKLFDFSSANSIVLAKNNVISNNLLLDVSPAERGAVIVGNNIRLENPPNGDLIGFDSGTTYTNEAFITFRFTGELYLEKDVFSAGDSNTYFIYDFLTQDSTYKITDNSEYLGNLIRAGYGREMRSESAQGGYVFSEMDVFNNYDFEFTGTSNLVVNAPDGGIYAPVGTTFKIFNAGGENLTIQGQSSQSTLQGVGVTNDSVDLAQQEVAYIQKVDGGLDTTGATWLVWGDLVSPYASIYLSGNTTNTTFGSPNQTYEPIVAGSNWQEKLSHLFTFNHDGTLTYNGTQTKLFTLYASVSVEIPGNHEIRVRIGVADSDLAETEVRTSIVDSSSPEIQVDLRDETLSTRTIHQLNPGDTVDVRIANWDNTDSVTVHNAQLSILPV